MLRQRDLFSGHPAYTTRMNIPNLSGFSPLLAIFAVFGATSCSQPEPPVSADLVVRDARVWTGDAEQPWAQAIASKGDRLIAVGSNADIDKLVGAGTEVVSATGGMLTPGFIDSHLHFLSGGSGLASVQLRDAQTPGEFAARIGAWG